MECIPATRPARWAVLALALAVAGGIPRLPAEPRSFTSAGGTTITAEPVSHDGAGGLTLKLANGTTSVVAVDKLSAEDQEWVAEWIKAHPAERDYHFTFAVVEKKLADLERAGGTAVRSKRQRWAYAVVVTNADRLPVRDLRVRYRVYMRDDVSGSFGVRNLIRENPAAGTTVRSEGGEVYRQKSGEESLAGEMRFNDKKEFLSESFDLDETRYTYYSSRARTKDRLAGIIIQVLDAAGRVVANYRSDAKWLASVEWEADADSEIEPVAGRPMPRRPPESRPGVPEVAGKAARKGGSRVAIAGSGRERPVKGSAAAAMALMLDASETAVPVRVLASTLPGGSDAGAMPVYFTSEVSREFGSLIAAIGRSMGTRDGGWPVGRDASLTWSAAFDPADGAAASGACALALDSLIGGIALDPGVAVASPLGGDLVVGGQKQLAARLAAAADSGCSVVLVGPGSREALGDLLVTGTIDPLWKVQVIGAADLAALRAVARTDREPELQSAMDEFAAVRMLVETGGSAALRSPAALASLKRVAAAVPSHLSAVTLLAFASGQTPATLSLAGSYDVIWNSAGPFLKAVRLHLGGKTADVESTRSALAEMRRLRPKMHPKVLELVDAIVDLEATWRDYASRGGTGRNAPLYGELGQASLKVSKLAEAVEAQL